MDTTSRTGGVACDDCIEVIKPIFEIDATPESYNNGIKIR
jgi:hypothetical protein